MDTTKTISFYCLLGWLEKRLCYFFFFFLIYSRIVSHSSFACKWQNMFWDSKPVIAHFPSNKDGTLDIRIPCNSLELHPTSCMHDVCHMHRLSPSCMSKKKKNLSLILLIPLAKQKMDICRHCILYPLWHGPPFPNDAQALRPNASLGLNQISNWLEECGNGKYNLLNKQKSIFENKMTKVSDKNAKCHIFLP